MQHIEPISGSPLLPIPYIIGYGLGFILLLGLIYLGVHFTSHHVHTRSEFKRFTHWTMFSILVILGYVAYLLIPAPSITKISPKNAESGAPLNKSIQIQFNRPVSRQVMEKSISPDVPGVWVFEKPFYATHLYRAITFYPSRTLNANETYKINLSNIKNVIQRSKSYSTDFSFTTQDYPKVSEVTPGDTIKVSLSSVNDEFSDFSFEFEPTVKFESVLSTDKKDYKITPSVPLETGKTYSFTVRKINLARDFDLNEVIGKSAATVETSGKFSWSGDNWIYTATSGVRDVQAKSSIQLDVKTFKLNVPAYLQQHTLSCEVSALRMTLAYKGISKSEDELLGLVGVDNTPHKGNVWGNPHEAFVGNVNGTQMKNGYGVYWGPIERVAKMFGNAKAFEHGNIAMLTQEIQNGNPVIIWTYSKNGTPTSWTTPSGVKIFAAAGEHSVVAVGFVGPADNPTQMIINDPLVGQVYWSRSLFDRKWATFSQSGVVIYK